MLTKNHIIYILIDFGAIVISFLFAMLTKYTSLQYTVLLVISSYLIVILFYQPKTPFLERSFGEEFRCIFLENMYMAFIVALSLYLLKVGEQSSRAFFLFFFFFNIFCMYLGRLYCKHLLISHFQKSENRKKLLIYANQSNVLKVMNKVVNAIPFDCDLVAVAIADVNEEQLEVVKIELNLIQHRKQRSYMVISQEDMAEYLKKHVIDEALICLPDNSRNYLNCLISRLENMGIVVQVTVNTFGLTEREKVINHFGTYRVLTYCARVFEPSEVLLKRMVDIFGGIIGVLFTFLLGIFIVPAIYLESPGPVIFKQKRVGKNGRFFSIYKFRSMYMDAEERKKELMSQNQMNGLMFKVKDDPRITKVGKFIRKTSIDEFPQFVNVLKGEMSLVGTRPPTIDEFMKYEEHHKRRLSLKPGITGLWQVMGRSEIQDFEDVVKLDLKYIDNWSIWSDIKILFQTVYVVFLGKGAG